MYYATLKMSRLFVVHMSLTPTSPTELYLCGSRIDRILRSLFQAPIVLQINELSEFLKLHNS
jgi:hypothetical protein